MNSEQDDLKDKPDDDLSNQDSSSQDNFLGKKVGESASTKLKSTPFDNEVGGPTGLEPTRFGDWEKKGRCIDF